MNYNSSWTELRPTRLVEPETTFAASEPLELEAREGLHIYRNYRKPAGSYTAIQFLTDGGRLFERHEIEATFIQRAKELGADALVLQPPVKSVEAPEGWTLYDTFLFEAAAVIYS